MLYLRWETRDKVIVKLVESKAKLTPLDQKGDVIMAELCGAVFATRLKRYFEKHCHINVKQWIHFVDSQTILAAIQKDSYGYQTFVANRIGEIQKAGQVEDWRWIEGKRNIADILTRGATPEEINEGSEWQQGPEFLKFPETDWPMKMAREFTPSAAEDVGKLQRKAFSAVVTRSQSKGRTGPNRPDIKAEIKHEGANSRQKVLGNWTGALCRTSTLQFSVQAVWVHSLDSTGCRNLAEKTPGTRLKVRD